MKVARIVNEQIEIGKVSEFFPQTSFPASGPNQAFLDEHGLLPVIEFIDHDPDMHDMLQAEPYLLEGIVYTVELQPLSPQKLYDVVVRKTLERLDEFAATRNYGSIMSAATYATSTIPKFAAEGQRAVELRDQTWTTLYQILEDIQAEQMEVPTSYHEIMALLPPLEWEPS